MGPNIGGSSAMISRRPSGGSRVEGPPRGALPRGAMPLLPIRSMAKTAGNTPSPQLSPISPVSYRQLEEFVAVTFEEGYARAAGEELKRAKSLADRPLTPLVTMSETSSLSGTATSSMLEEAAAAMSTWRGEEGSSSGTPLRLKEEEGPAPLPPIFLLTGDENLATTKAQSVEMQWRASAPPSLITASQSMPQMTSRSPHASLLQATRGRGKRQRRGRRRAG